MRIRGRSLQPTSLYRTIRAFEGARFSIKYRLNPQSFRQSPRRFYSLGISVRNMSSGPSTAIHPVSSTSGPAPPAEGLSPITPGASATKANGDAKKEGKEKQGKPKEKKDQKASGSGAGGGGLELAEPPGFFAERIKLYDVYKAKYDKWVSGEINGDLAVQCSWHFCE